MSSESVSSPIDNFVSVVPLLRVSSGKSNIFDNLAALFCEETSTEERNIFYDFGFADSGLICVREAYFDGAAFLTHLTNVDHLLRHLSMISSIEGGTVIGPADEMEVARDACQKMNLRRFDLLPGAKFDESSPSSPSSHIMLLMTVRPKDSTNSVTITSLLESIHQAAITSRYYYSGIAKPSEGEPDLSLFLLRQGFPDAESFTVFLASVAPLLSKLEAVVQFEKVEFIGPKKEWETVKESQEFSSLSMMRFFEAKLPPVAVTKNIQMVRSQMQNYAEGKSVGEIVAAMIHTLLLERPEDPYSFMEVMKWAKMRQSDGSDLSFYF